MSLERAKPEIVKNTFKLLKALVPFVAVATAFGCGYLGRHQYGSYATQVHDHDNRGNRTKPRIGYVANEDWQEEIRTNDLYDPKKHGPLVGWVEEGDVVNVDGQPLRSTDGKLAHHNHNAGSANGAIEYKYDQ